MWLQSNTTHYQILHSTPCETEKYTKHPVLYPRIITQITLHHYPRLQCGYKVTQRTIRYYTAPPCVTEKYTKHPVLYPRILHKSYITLLPRLQYYPRLHIAYTRPLSINFIGCYVVISITQSYLVFPYTLSVPLYHQTTRHPR